MSGTQDFKFKRSLEMDSDSYEVLVSTLKASLCNVDRSSKQYFNNIILECQDCIKQCLCAAINSIDSINCNYSLHCLENASCLLQMLSDFINKVLKSTPFVCSEMKEYPIATGSIILSVFDHCKTSECVYGEYLNKVERQLKELFRTCHELQLTYLMTLEKHFTFDLSQVDDLDILLEVLDLNLKIGQVVKNLDIKTMAEQWKSYTALCDKYCKYIEDKHIYRKCVDMLCEMVQSNMKIVLEMRPDEGVKAAMRPVKVASFGIKILTKVCNIFKKATRDNDEITYLLIFLYTHNTSYMETFLEKPRKVTYLIEEYVRGPLDALFIALVANPSFIDDICKVNEREFDNEKYIGYLILLTNSLNLLLNNKTAGETKLNVIKRMFRLLPNGHIWFNVGLKIQFADKAFGLFEYALTVTSAFARSASDDHFEALERLMLASLLGSECYGALFAADLWVLSMRSSDSKAAAETTARLLEVHRSLARKQLFRQSPQRVYLTRVIRNLFRLCTERDRDRILNSYKVEDNFDVWAGLKSTEIAGRHRNAVSLFIAMLKGCLGDDGVENLLTPADPVPGKKQTDQISETVLALWRESRPGECSAARERERLRRLAALTDCFARRMSEEALGEVHNAIGEKLKSCIEPPDLAYTLLQKYCSSHERGVVPRSSLSRDVFAELLRANDEIRRHVIPTLHRFDRVHEAVRADPDLFALLADDGSDPRPPGSPFRARLRSVEKYRFSHKCVSGDSRGSEGRSDFDANVCSPLDEADEPRSKKPKLRDGECEELISSLEGDVCRLRDLRAELRDEQRLRLTSVVSKLQNILES